MFQIIHLIVFRYPEVTPKHEVAEDGQPAFHTLTIKAAEHLYAIIDGKPKEVLGTTYSHIKEIVTSVHECGYFDKVIEAVSEVEENQVIVPEEEIQEPVEEEVEVEQPNAYPPAGALPVPPAPAVVPAPAYPLRPLPPITLQEVEHAYFSQQYPQQRPITEVIGSQNFFFLQESEIDSPVGTPQPPPIPNQASPPAPIPTQTFTNQHFVPMPGGRVPDAAAMPLPPQPHFPPHPEHSFPPVTGVPMPAPLPHPAHVAPMPVPAAPAPAPAPAPLPAAVNVHVHTPVAAAQPEERSPVTPPEDKNDDEWKETPSPERDEGADRKTQGQGDGQNRFRRPYRGGGRGAPNGHRGRGAYPSRQSGDGYRGRHGGEYQNRSKDNYQSRQYDGYQSRHKDGYQSRTADDGYYGNGDTGDHRENENGGRDRYNDNSYQGGFKSRGRGGPRGGHRGAPRAPRPQQYNRKPENVE